MTFKDKKINIQGCLTCAFVFHKIHDRDEPLRTSEESHDALNDPFTVLLSHDGYSYTSLTTTTVTAAAAAAVESGLHLRFVRTRTRTHAVPADGKRHLLITAVCGAAARAGARTWHRHTHKWEWWRLICYYGNCDVTQLQPEPGS